MSEIMVKFTQLKNAESELQKCKSDLSGYIQRVSGEANNVQLSDATAANIRRRLLNLLGQMEKEKTSVGAFETSIASIITKYNMTEDAIIQNAGGTVLNVSVKPGGPANFELGMTPIHTGLITPDLSGLENIQTVEDLQNAVEDDEWWEKVGKYLGDSFWQALIGDFYTGDDATVLGLALSVGIGFIPIVGQIADVRDLVADVWNLIDDGPTTEEWVALGFTALGIIPGVGDALKHSDDVMGAVNKLRRAIDPSVLNHLDEATDVAKRFVKNTGDFFSGKADDIAKAASKKADDVVKSIAKHAEDFAHGNNIAENVVNGTEKFMKNAKDIFTKEHNILPHAVDDLFDSDALKTFFKSDDPISGLNLVKGMIEETIDDYKEKGVTWGLDNLFGGGSEPSNA